MLGWRALRGPLFRFEAGWGPGVDEMCSAHRALKPSMITTTARLDTIADAILALMVETGGEHAHVRWMHHLLAATEALHHRALVRDTVIVGRFVVLSFRFSGTEARPLVQPGERALRASLDETVQETPRIGVRAIVGGIGVTEIAPGGIGVDDIGLIPLYAVSISVGSHVWE